MKLPISIISNGHLRRSTRFVAFSRAFCFALLALGPLELVPLEPMQGATANAGAIYKSVDKDGNVIFTDQPLEGAESLNKQAERAGADESESDKVSANPSDEDSGTEGVLVAPQPKNPPKTTYNASTEEPTRFLPVTTVEILTPIHNATLHDPIGNSWVEVQSFPTPLKETGLTAQLWMDDKLITSGKRPMLSLPAPERGTHVLRVKLVDDKGRLYLESKPSHIHVKYRVVGQ